MPDLDEIRSLRINAGDTLVVRVKDLLSQQMVQHVEAQIRAGLSDQLKDVKILVLGGTGISMDILRDGRTGGPGLPPAGAAGDFLGFDSHGRAYLLRWVVPRGEVEGAWRAVGFDQKFTDAPWSFVATANDGFIIQHKVLE